MATRLTRAESKAATRDVLLDTARRVFVDRGYHGASLDQVAREAGFTKGAVYSAFGSKGAMFLAVWDREIEERWARLEAEPLRGDELRRRRNSDWFERIRAERGWTLALLEFRLQAARDPQLNAAYAERHRRVVERVGAMLGRAGGDPDAALDVVALSNGYALEHVAIPDEATEERYAAAVAALADRR